MTITLSADLEQRIQEKVAAGEAENASALVERLVRDALDSGSDEDWEWLGRPAPTAEERGQAIREIRELSRTITLGADLNIRDLIEQGRR